MLNVETGKRQTKAPINRPFIASQLEERRRPIALVTIYRDPLSESISFRLRSPCGSLQHRPPVRGRNDFFETALYLARSWNDQSFQAAWNSTPRPGERFLFPPLRKTPHPGSFGSFGHPMIVGRDHHNNSRFARDVAQRNPGGESFPRSGVALGYAPRASWPDPEQRVSP